MHTAENWRHSLSRSRHETPLTTGSLWETDQPPPVALHLHTVTKRSPERNEMSTEGPSPSMVIVARSLLLDRAAAVAVEHLRRGGVPSILLKGAAIATWLYDSGEARPYVDVDLLVPPAQFDIATELLSELGYRPRLIGADRSELGPKELDLLGPTNLCIDLHHGLLGASGPAQYCWEVLDDHTVTLRMGEGIEVPVLDLPARVMHLALHAAQNGPIDAKAVNDLERGLSKVRRSDWERAAVLAKQIGAAEAFAAGLRLVPAGQALADELSLTRRLTVELALRTRSAPPEAMFFERLREAQGARAKAALLRRRLFPTPASLRDKSALARSGPVGMFVARLVHPYTVAARLGPAWIAWLRAWRLTKRLS